MNPVSIQEVDGLSLSIEAFGLYSIDDWDGPMGWTLYQGSFVETGTFVRPSSPIAYDKD